MESAWLARWRWRRRGAWLWPTFIGVTLLDGVIGHLLPPAGESQQLVGAALVGCFLNLFAVVALAWPVSLLLRRRRPDLPKVVARDYGGTIAIWAIAGGILALGVAHRSAVQAERRAAADAVARAQAWIGARAPAEFRRHARYVDSYAIQPGSIYRECVPGTGARREFCVVVRIDLPFARSVRFAGYEPNWIFSEGTQ